LTSAPEHAALDPERASVAFVCLVVAYVQYVLYEKYPLNCGGESKFILTYFS